MNTIHILLTWHKQIIINFCSLWEQFKLFLSEPVISKLGCYIQVTERKSVKTSSWPEILGPSHRSYLLLGLPYIWTYIIFSVTFGHWWKIASRRPSLGTRVRPIKWLCWSVFWRLCFVTSQNRISRPDSDLCGAKRKRTNGGPLASIVIILNCKTIWQLNIFLSSYIDKYTDKNSLPDQTLVRLLKLLDPSVHSFVKI